MTKSKIAILLTTDAFAKMYLSDDILHKLSKKFDVKLLVTDTVDVNNYVLPEEVEIERFECSDVHERAHAFASLVLIWRNRKKSSTFSWRIRREFRGALNLVADSIRNLRFANTLKPISLNSQSTINKSSKNKIINFCTKWTRNVLYRTMIRILASKLFFHPFRRRYLVNLPMNDELTEILRRNRFALVIYPNIAFGALSTQLVHASKQVGSKTLFLIDNWDNLSSKSVLWELPDFICTWGIQNNIFAREIHGFQDDQIFNIGTPRFEGYRKRVYENNLENSHELEDCYVLFLDTVARFNSHKALTVVSKAMKEVAEHTKIHRIIYRPHPGTDWHRRIHLDQLPWGVELDPLTLSNLRSQSNSKLAAIPTNDYLADLVANCQFVVGGATSMLIEASLLKKKYVLIGNKEWLNVESPRMALDNYKHLEGIGKLGNVQIASNLTKLSEIVKENIVRSLESRFEEVNQEQLRFFYTQKKEPFSQNLCRLVEDLIISAGNPIQSFAK